MENEKRVGKCQICGINLYGGNARPKVWPCNVGLFRETNLKKADRVACPYETPETQMDFIKMKDGEVVAGMLGTQFGGTFDDG